MLSIVNPQKIKAAQAAKATSDAKDYAASEASYNAYGPIDTKTGLSVNHKSKLSGGGFSPTLHWLTAGKVYRDAHKQEKSFFSGLDDFVNGLPGGWLTIAGAGAAIAMAPAAAGGFGLGGSGGASAAAGSGISVSAQSGGTFFGVAAPGATSGVTGLTYGAGGVTGLTTTAATTLGTGSIEAALAGTSFLNAANSASYLDMAKQAKTAIDGAKMANSAISTVKAISGAKPKMIPTAQQTAASEFAQQAKSPANTGAVNVSPNTAQPLTIVGVIALAAVAYFIFKGAKK